MSGRILSPLRRALLDPAPVHDLPANGNLRGRTLAHFELLDPIGVGGMAAVIRARDKQLDRVVALKILPPEMAVDPEHVQRFHQEARAAAKLDISRINIEDIKESADEADEVLLDFYARHRMRLLLACLCYVTAWSLGPLEIYILLKLLHQTATVQVALP